MTLIGTAAIEFAEANDLLLNKYTDPTEEAREGLTPDEARAVVREDPRLIWIEAPAWEIQTRIGDGPWQNNTVGDPNEFASEQEALEMIEELKGLQDDSWRTGEYRVACKGDAR